jgi:RimJ/RimL family protein N-acetyltransferase
VVGNGSVRVQEIETARLRLRPLAGADVDELHALWTSPEMRKYLWDDEVITRERTVSIVGESLRLFAAHGYGLWGARLHDQERLTGFGGFWYFRAPPELALRAGYRDRPGARPLRL